MRRRISVSKRYKPLAIRRRGLSTYHGSSYDPMPEDYMDAELFAEVDPVAADIVAERYRVELGDQLKRGRQLHREGARSRSSSSGRRGKKKPALYRSKGQKRAASASPDADGKC